MTKITECKPEQIEQIPWGWKNQDGWVVEPLGRIEMPRISEFFDWQGEWIRNDIFELPSPDGNTCYGTTAMKSVFTTASRFLGMEEAMIQLYTGEIDNGLRIIADEMLLWNENLINSWPDGKPMIAIQGDEIGSTKGMMISPELYKKSIAPLHKEFVNLYRSHRVPIWYHSDGYIKDALDTIFEIGYEGVYYEPLNDLGEILGDKGVIVQR